MTVTDQIKILNRRIKQNEAQYDLDRKAAKISALSSNNLDKYEYLTGEDLGLKPSTVEEAKFEYSPLGMSLSQAFKKDDVKSITKSKSDFFKFYKSYDEFKEMSLDSKYNRMKDFNKLFISFKSLKTKKTETELKKERIMKNIDELYKNYFNTYKGDYDTDDELKEDRKKKFDYKQFELDDEINKESKLHEKTKELELTKLPKSIKVSKKRFNTIKNVVQNARKNNLQARPQHSSPINFDNSNKLIQDIIHGNITHEEALNKMADIDNNF